MSNSPNFDPKAHPFFGKTLARCEIGEALGRGRTSWVCRAHHTTLDRDVAIKVLTGDVAELDEIRSHFLGEARALAKIDHPHIVKVLDVVDDAGHLCILMEYVAGETLQDRLKAGGPLPVRKALRIALQIARALEAAHAEKIVHRDVKPANVLLVQGTDEVKMVDFGLAGPKTLANRAGTPLYMSPEASQGKRIDEKSDIYALGVCTYQMLTGKLPHGGKSVRAILASHVKGEYPLPSAAHPPLGKDYDDVIKKLMVGSKGYRPTAGEAVALLEPLIAGDAGSAKGARGRGAGRGGRRTRSGRSGGDGPPVSVIVAGIAAVVLGLVAFLVLGNDDPAPTPSAPGTTPATNGTSSTAPTTTQPVTPPPPPAKSDAEFAFEDAQSWVTAHPGEWAEIAKKWTAVADVHGGTEFGKRARENATAAEERRRQEAEIAGRNAEREAREKRTKEARDALDVVLARYDFAAASRMAEPLLNRPGETIQEWRAKKRRIAFLEERFLPAFNDNVAGRSIVASYLKDSAGHDEIIIEADAEGVSTQASGLQRRIKWADVPAEKLFRFLSKQCVSTTDLEGIRFLAIFAAEAGLEKQSKDQRELAGLVASPDQVREAFVEYFE